MTQTQMDFEQPETVGKIVRRIARNEQEKEARRVGGNIDPFVLEFFETRGVGAEFFMRDLTAFVGEKARGYVAPDSPRRRMNALHNERLLRYELVSKSKSLYRVLEIAERGQPCQ